MQAGNPWKLLFSRQYRPELLVSSLVAFFSQINVRPHAIHCSRCLHHLLGPPPLVNMGTVMQTHATKGSLLVVGHQCDPVLCSSHLLLSGHGTGCIAGCSSCGVHLSFYCCAQHVRVYGTSCNHHTCLQSCLDPFCAWTAKPGTMPSESNCFETDSLSAICRCCVSLAVYSKGMRG